MIGRMVFGLEGGGRSSVMLHVIPSFAACTCVNKCIASAPSARLLLYGAHHSTILTSLHPPRRHDHFFTGFSSIQLEIK